MSSIGTSQAFIRAIKRHAANTPPVIDPITGDRILKYGKWFLVISTISIATCIGFTLLWVNAPNSLSSTIDVILFIIMIAFFTSGGIYFVLLTYLPKVIVTDERISAKTFFKFKSIDWQDITSVNYSDISDSFIIRSSQKFIRISPGLNGIISFIDDLEEKIPEEVFSKQAKLAIHKTRSLVRK